MTDAHLHLVLNHIPVLGTVFGAAILAYGLWRRQDAVVRVALGLFVVGALGATGAYFTGEGAEDAVEGLPGVAETAIEAHEEIALYAYALSVVLGVAALGVLLWNRASTVRRATGAAVLALAVVVAGVMGYTANQGGAIRHSEIRTAAAAHAPNASHPPDPSASDAEQTESHDEEDEDDDGDER